MRVYLVSVGNGYGEGYDLGVFSSEESAERALREEGYNLEEFEGRPHWMNHGTEMVFASIFPREVR